MANSTKALMLKVDGTVAEPTFFSDNAAALNAAVSGGGEGDDAPVASVNGKTGTVVLAASDVGAAAATATATALALKADKAITLTTANSLQGGGDLSGNRTLQLVGDTNSPGTNKFYGTDGGGTRGWQALPAAPPTLATQAQAEAGTDNATGMSPLRTAQAIAALGAAPVLVGAGSLLGNNSGGSDEVPASSPTASFQCGGGAIDGDTVAIVMAGTTYTFEFDPSNDGVAGGNLAVAGQDADAMQAALNAAGFPNVVNNGGGGISFSGTDTGSGATISITPSNTGDITAVVTTNGTDDAAAVPPTSGAVMSVQLIASVTAKVLTPFMLLAKVVGGTGFSGGSVLIQSGGTTLATLDMSGANAAYDLLSSGILVSDILACAASQPLTATLTGDTPTNGQVDIMIAAIAV